MFGHGRERANTREGPQSEDDGTDHRSHTERIRPWPGRARPDARPPRTQFLGRHQGHHQGRVLLPVDLCAPDTGGPVVRQRHPPRRRRQDRRLRRNRRFGAGRPRELLRSPGTRLPEPLRHLGVLPHLRLLELAGLHGPRWIPGAPSRSARRTLPAPGSRAGARRCAARGSRWPGTGTGTGTRCIRAPGRGALAPAPRTMAGAPASPPESASDVIYCSWCGKQRARNAQAIHHCGSRERPAAFCMGCGTPLEEGAPGCASCGTAATQLSL